MMVLNTESVEDQNKHVDGKITNDKIDPNNIRRISLSYVMFPKAVVKPRVLKLPQKSRTLHEFIYRGLKSCP